MSPIRIANPRHLRVIIYLLLVFIVLMTVLAEANTNAVASNAAAKDVYQVTMTDTVRTFGALQSQETGQRGYLLTQDPAYLAAYNRGATRYAGIMRELKAVASSDPQVSARVAIIEAKGREKVSELKTTKDMVEQGQAQKALKVLKLGNGLRLMEDIRAQVQAIVNYTSIQIKAKDAQDRINTNRIHITTILAGSAGLFLTILLLAMLGRYLDLQSRSDKSLRDANESLEQRVNDRTMALTQANRELEAFCYSIAHDLRAPLREVALLSGMLVSDLGKSLETEDKDSLESVELAARRMSNLIEDLLEYARLPRRAISKKHLDISAVVNEVVEQVKLAGDTSDVTFEVQANMTAEADPGLIKLVFQNLIENSYKYRKPNSHIQIGMDDSGAFFVKDNGIGFDSKFTQKMFLPFERLHSDPTIPGTGIGLANVKRIVELHGGKVWAEGEVGVGATFHFRI